MQFKIIAIDGPSGVGKSTISSLLAGKLDFFYVDTGAMFRCLAWNWERLGCPENKESLLKLGNQTEISFKNENARGSRFRVPLNPPFSRKVSFPLVLGGFLEVGRRHGFQKMRFDIFFRSKSVSKQHFHDFVGPQKCEIHTFGDGKCIILHFPGCPDALRLSNNVSFPWRNSTFWQIVEISEIGTSSYA